MGAGSLRRLLFHFPSKRVEHREDLLGFLDPRSRSLRREVVEIFARKQPYQGSNNALGFRRATRTLLALELSVYP